MTPGQTVYLVGQVIEADENGVVGEWHVHGLFSSESKALEACHGPEFFIGPLKLDEELSMEETEWENAYYPIEGEKLSEDCGGEWEGGTTGEDVLRDVKDMQRECRNSSYL